MMFNENVAVGTGNGEMKSCLAMPRKSMERDE
jgi:hypothetical protein